MPSLPVYQFVVSSLTLPSRFGNVGTVLPWMKLSPSHSVEPASPGRDDHHHCGCSCSFNMSQSSSCFSKVRVRGQTKAVHCLHHMSHSAPFLLVAALGGQNMLPLLRSAQAGLVICTAYGLRNTSSPRTFSSLFWNDSLGIHALVGIHLLPEHSANGECFR
jgi:hypothetical protein